MFILATGEGVGSDEDDNKSTSHPRPVRTRRLHTPFTCNTLEAKVLY